MVNRGRGVLPFSATTRDLGVVQPQRAALDMQCVRAWSGRHDAALDTRVGNLTSDIARCHARARRVEAATNV